MATADEMEKYRKEMGGRLRWARENSDKDWDMKKASNELKIPYGTYSGHEEGTRGIKYPELVLYCRTYNVDMWWLVTGLGDPRGQALNHAQVLYDELPDDESRQKWLNIGRVLKGG